MRTTQVGAAIDRLLTVLAPVVIAPRLLLDGPQVAGDADTDIGDAVYVGWWGDPNDFTAADFAQTWRGLGARAKDESIPVRCVCVYWDGEDDPASIKARRDAVLTTFGLVETALRADPGQGQPGPSIYAVESGALVQPPGSARLPFIASVRARI